jgi:dipeptidyl aminopeptidase/acylaminoacyl peptidase
MLALEQLLRIPYVEPEAGFDITPDGKQVAFSWNRTGQWEIYRLHLENPGQIEQITHGPGAKFGPRYSPDGAKLAYALDLDGSETFDLYLCDLARGAHTNLTPGTPATFQPKLSWSPDGEYLACISDESGRFSTYLLEVSAGERRLLFDRSGPHCEVRWSPDGSRLAVVAEGNGQDYFTHIVVVQGGAVQSLEWQGALLNAKDVCWSPDGKRLAFCSDISGFYQIGLYSIENGQIDWLTRGEGEKTSPDWSPDGKRLTYLASLGPDSCLAVQDLPGDVRRWQVEPGVHYSPRFTPDGEQIVFVFDNPRNPDDLWLLDLKTRDFQPLTRSLPAELSAQDFILPQHIDYPSRDGALVPALLYLPSAGASAHLPGHSPALLPPAVIVIHGGPNWLFQFLWYPLMTHLASRGWVVLAPNYRGSTGYGREWQRASRFELGHLDAMDVAAGADYLVQNRLADPQRIALTGRSHGGYLTLCCLTQYPERWAAGSAVVPFLNWFTSHARSRLDLQHWDIENMGDPQENHALWHARSPFFFLDRIQAPVQLICGANDPRCPASESLAARDALMALGKPVELLLYPDEGHAFLKIENVVDHELRRVAFLSGILDAFQAGNEPDCKSTSVVTDHL